MRKWKRLESRPLSILLFALCHEDVRAVSLLLATASATADTYIAAYGENIVADLSLDAIPKFLLRLHPPPPTSCVVIEL